MDTLYLFSKIMITLLMEFLEYKWSTFDYFHKIGLRHDAYGIELLWSI